MPATTDPQLAVLIGLRLVSFGAVELVAARAGLSPETTEQVLRGLADDGLVRHRRGATPGWQLVLPAGREAGEDRALAQLASIGASAVVRGAYRRFLALNPRLLSACTMWQVRDVDGVPTPNDHVDAAHDARAIAALVLVDEDVQPTLSTLAGTLDRFAGYPGRLAAARRRVEAGDPTWFTSLTEDSYHAVWFELHEHLLAILGIDRSTEGQPGRS